jgi:hypothetical protein
MPPGRFPYRRLTKPMFANSTELVKFLAIILTDLMRFVAGRQHPIMLAIMIRGCRMVRNGAVEGIHQGDRTGCIDPSGVRQFMSVAFVRALALCSQRGGSSSNGTQHDRGLWSLGGGAGR